MSNEEIIELLRELSQKADEAGEVKSRTVRINFDPDEVGDTPSEKDEVQDIHSEKEEMQEKPALGGLLRKIRRPKPAAEETDTEGAEPEEIPEELETEDIRTKDIRTKVIRTKTSRIKDTETEKLEAEDTEEDFEAEDFEEDFETEVAEGNDVTVLAEAEGNTRRQKSSMKKSSMKKSSCRQLTFESDAADFMDDLETERLEEERVAKQREQMQAKIRRVSDGLKDKGIGRRELIMIISGVALLALIGVIIFNVVTRKQMSRRIDADDGLSITVEKEPAKWCNHGEVTLGIKTSSPIQSITINSENYEFSGTTKTKLTFEAFSQTLDVMVVSEDQVRNATVELAKVDSEDPVITVSMENGLISLNAQDSGSGVAGIWVGTALECTDIPGYVEYTEPFKAEEGALYSYFAADAAGNATDPVVTDMTPAKSLTLDREEITLFPGETGKLKVTAEPENAYINGMQMTNSNNKVISLGADGTITALAEGESNVKITADGLAPVVCHISVRTSASLMISAVGDVTLGDDINFNPLNSFSTVQATNGSSYFFDNVRSIFEADDITFANFEGTLTEQGTRADKQYAFRGDPSYTDILKDGSIEVVTLANNHSSDYGEVSLTDTEKYLDEAKIDYCKDEKIVLKDVNGIRVALIGIYVLDTGLEKAAMVESTIKAAKEAGAQLIVIAFHWGDELDTKPNDIQQTLAHTAVDLGADLVVGHHPHVLQGIEKYSGKYICYSLGNFCFGGNSSPSDMDSMIFQQTFEVRRGGVVEAGEATVIPVSISSATDWNNYQPTPAVGEEYERIMQKINDRCTLFKTSF